MALDWLVEILRCNGFHGTLIRVVDRNAGGEHGRTDRLTDRIGLGVLTRLVHRDLVDEVLADTGTGCSTARPPNTYKEIRDRRTVTMGGFTEHSSRRGTAGALTAGMP